MGRNELCFCGSGKKTKKCHNDIHELSLASNLLRLYYQIDREIEKNYKLYKNEIPCYKGCAECCFTDYPVTDVEFNMIVYEMWKWDKDKISKIIESAQKTWSIVIDKYPEYINLLKTDGTGNDIAIKTNMIQTDQELFRCPFLHDIDNSCLIYEIRPVTCRVWGVGYLNDYKIRGDYCSNIKDFALKKNWQSDLSFLKEEINSMDSIFIRDIDQLIKVRRRPLFYQIVKFQDLIEKKEGLPISFKKEFYEPKSVYEKYWYDIYKTL